MTAKRDEPSAADLFQQWLASSWASAARPGAMPAGADGANWLKAWQDQLQAQGLAFPPAATPGPFAGWEGRTPAAAPQLSFDMGKLQEVQQRYLEDLSLIHI